MPNSRAGRPHRSAPPATTVKTGTPGQAQETRSAAPIGDSKDLPSLIGTRLRELRQERGIGLRSLAAGSGITSGFLSQIESGRVMPSVATLVRLCAVLQVHVGDVFDESGSRARLVRAAERAVYAYPDAGITDEVLTADPTYRIEVVRSLFAPGGSTGGQLYSRGSQVEAAVVLRGQLVISLENEEFLLDAGDALTFPGTLPHDVRNPSKDPAEVIWIYSPATY